MATAKEGGDSKFSHSLSSEDTYDLVCQPCEMDGRIQEAVGMCTDCQDYLCQRCFDVHTLPIPMRNHQLLNKEHMVLQQASLRKDKCSEKCTVHEDEVIKYYCVDHHQLGCNDCITLNHRSCDNVTYIPRAAKDLTNNDEYKQAERQLESVTKRAKTVTENYEHKAESLEKGCSEAVRMIQDFRKDINKTLDNIETCFVRKCETLKAEELEKMTLISDKLKTVNTDLHILNAMVERYQNNKQNCNLYTIMINAKETILLVEDRLKEADKEQSTINSQIKFFPNKETLFLLKSSESFGKLSKSGASNFTPEQAKTSSEQMETTTAVARETPKITVRAKHVQDTNVKCRSDKKSCSVSGLVHLPNNKLLIADSEGLGCGNGNVKLVDVKQGQVITQLILSSAPWDAAMVTDSQVAVTLPADKKVAFINIETSAMNVERTLDVNGECKGVDYRGSKLVVSFSNPNKVQILTLKGRLLYTVTVNDQGQTLFNSPNYVSFGKDGISMYVSNFLSNNVVHMKFDGTVVGTYTDSELRRPGAVLTDSSGNVYVCGGSSNNIHQITPDCRKIQVILSEADSLYQPYSISYNEADNKLYVGMYDCNVVKIYKMSRL